MPRGQHNRRIALFAANAPVALRVALHMKERHGADWQRRVALMSIDDSEWAELAGMTTVRQPTYTIGERAVEFLHERIEGAAWRRANACCRANWSCGHRR